MVGYYHIMSSFTNKLGVLSLFLAILLLSSLEFFIVSLIVTIVAWSSIKYLQNWWVEGAPNEWVLVIKNGKMVRSGVGLKTLVFPNETYVKFPSKVEKVEFKAENVTKQNQGIEIEGFAFWSVFREDDGPFKCYKYMQGGNPNDNVRTMCQSVIRNQLANSSLMEVLRERNLIKDNIKRDLEKQLCSWGIWLETVELTEVKICSKKLFEDLQADFRQTLSSQAESFTLQTNEKLAELRMESEQKLATIRQNKQTESLIITSNQKIKKVEEETAFSQKKYEFEKRKLQKEKEVRLAQINKDQELEISNIEHQQTLEKNNKDFETKSVQKEISNLQTHDEKTIEKYAVDAAERVFKRQYRSIALNQFVGDEQGIAKMLPGLLAVGAAIVSK